MAYFFLTSSLILFFLTISRGHLLTSVLEQFQANREIFAVTGEHESIPISIASKYFYSSLQYGLSPNMAQIRARIAQVFESTSDIAIVLDIHRNDSIFEVLTLIGNASASLRELRRISTFVMWPYQINKKAEIRLIKESKSYIDATQNFLVNSQLFFLFKMMNSSGSLDNLIYESYRAEKFRALDHLQNGLVLWGCVFCEGISLRRFNFHKRILKVTAVNDTEINDDIHVYVDGNGTVSYSEDGFSGTLLEILKHLLNFTTEPQLATEFGKRIPGTNKWKGSIGDVAEGVVDLAISVTIFQPDRAEVVSFLPPSDEHLIHAFFTPPNKKSVRDIFAQPFALDLWAAVISTWIILATCMIIFSIVRKRYGVDALDTDLTNEDKSEPDFTQDSFMWALGTACQQGWDEHPKALSLRAIFISGSFTGVVAYAGYSAAIVSTLSLRIEPIQNPVQLLQSQLDVGIRKGFISSLLEQNKSMDTMSKFHKKVERTPDYLRYLNISSGVDRILKDDYAFITTRDTIYDYLKATTDDMKICKIKDMPVLKYGFPLGYPIPKFSPYREILRYAMTMIREPGILHRLRMKYAFQRRCLDTGGAEGNALGLTDMFTGFMILCGGFVLSFAFVFVERFYSRFQQFTYIR